ncbi:MAG: RNA-binding protein [Legionellales bacterium]|nr:RNA-binding protein [Legionellales bacterium]
MNQNKIYVGNLSYGTTAEALRDAFVSFGEIAEVKLITDRETGRSKGFAFITFEDGNAAKTAVKLNGNDLDGRPMKVSLARENDRNDRGGRGGDRGSRGGYGGGMGGRR